MSIRLVIENKEYKYTINKNLLGDCKNQMKEIVSKFESLVSTLDKVADQYDAGDFPSYHDKNKNLLSDIKNEFEDIKSYIAKVSSDSEILKK